MKDLGKYEIAHTYKHGKPYVLTPRENQIMEEAVMQLAKNLLRYNPPPLFHYEDMNTFDQMLERWRNNKSLYIWTGAQEGNPFNPGVNLWFRWTHDIIHCENGLTFSFEDERKVFEKTMEYFWIATTDHHVRDNFELIKKVCFSEIVGQAAYFCEFGEFFSPQKLVMDWE